MIQKILISLALIFLVSRLSFAANDEEVFKKDLADFTVALQKENISARDLEKPLNAFNEFSAQYPGSPYADDAEFMVLFGAVTARQDEAGWARFLKKYPNGTLEDLTKKELAAILGNEVYLPYPLIKLYQEGYEAYGVKDYRKAAKCFSEVAGRADEKDPNIKKLIKKTEYLLLMIYTRLGDADNVQKTKDKIASLTVVKQPVSK